MILVDTALRKRAAAGNPVRVAMVGAGFMGRGVALQILSVVPGMRLVAISNRHLDGARRAYTEAGAEDIVANATGMRVARRGMFGPTVPTGTPLHEAIQHYPLDTLTAGPRC